jgi:hypothetical protein
VDAAWRRSGRERGGGPGRDMEQRDVVADRCVGAQRGARSSSAGCGTRQCGKAVGVALTGGVDGIVRPIRFSNRIKFISNGFKFAPNFDR